jgi:hypothetical protein
LADFYIRSGHFEKARDIFEESLGTITNVKDFSLIWDAYIAFEDSLLTAKMQAVKEATGYDVACSLGGGDANQRIFRGAADASSSELDLLVARYEALIDRRALLLSSVQLRANPNNVREWHKRVKLFEDPQQVPFCLICLCCPAFLLDPQRATPYITSYYECCNLYAREISSPFSFQRCFFSCASASLPNTFCRTSSLQIVDTFTTALRTVDPLNAKGKPHTLWVGFARFYEAHGEILSARKIMEKAVVATYVCCAPLCCLHLLSLV